MATNYKCGATGCYSYNSPETNAAIRSLQAQINRYSADPSIGFTPIAIDGVVGKGTFTALCWALTIVGASEIGGGWPGAANSWIIALNKPEDVVQELALADLGPMLKAAGDMLGLPGSVPGSTTAQPNSIPKPLGPAAAGVLKNIQAMKPATSASIFDAFLNLSTTVKWGLATVVIGGGVFAFTRSKKRRALTAG